MENILDDQFNEDIYFYEGAPNLLQNLIGICVYSLYVVGPILIFGFYFLIFSVVIISYLVWRDNFKSKNSYLIKEDSIRFFNSNRPDNYDEILISNIDQARYEDDFGEGWETPSSMLCYIYLKKNPIFENKRIEKEKTILPIKNNNIHSTILVLKHFQSKNIPVYIITKKNLMKEELGLQNWDKS